jgi:sugar transferase EpsL
MKRLLDFMGALILLVVLSPVLLMLTILIRAQLGSPVFFRQIRPGYKGKAFTIVKFRTMRDAVDRNGRHLPDELRLTSLGQKLRAGSLDELPELWNVLKGEMSLVGPRPLLMEFLPYYSIEQARRHEVRPGMTGWAQINGRNSISWEDKLKYDVWYVDNWSLLLDLKILFLTIPKVLAREDIPYGHATIPSFIGPAQQSAEHRPRDGS